MALYRNIRISFWTDSKIIDEFTPEDRYFYLYLFTNPHTNLAGCYEISMKQASTELGYEISAIKALLKRFEDVHKVIRYSKDTKEVLLLNWYRYNWTTSEKFRKPLSDEIVNIKCESFKKYLIDAYNDKYTVSIPYVYGIDTTVAVTDTVSDTDTVTDIWKSLSVSQIDSLHDTYVDADDLIQAVYEDVKDKRKLIDNPYAYIIGYASNKGWCKVD